MKSQLFKLFALIRKTIYLLLFYIDQVIGLKNPVTIYSYHSFARDSWRFSVDPEMFERQLQYLEKRYQFIEMTEFESFLQGKLRFTKPVVLICIDDGYADLLAIKPNLDKRNIKPVLFVLSNTTNPNRIELGNNNKFLSINQLKELAKDNWVIGCHSSTHANLATLNNEQLVQEIENSKNILESELGFDVKYFAYPRGKYNPDVIKTIVKAKYDLAFTMDDGRIDSSVNRLQIPRIGVDRSHTFVEFKTLMSPSVILFRQIMKKFIGGYL